MTFLNYISDFVKLNEKERVSIDEKLRPLTVSKGTYLLNEEEIANKLYFIRSGSVRTLYEYKDREITSWIYREGQVVSSWTSFLTQQPSTESIEASENCELEVLTYRDLQELYSNYPVIQEFGRKMAEQQVMFIDHFYKGYMFLTAKEKYERLLLFFPNVTQRLNLGHIASFLGMSQETLSRTRAIK